MHELKVNVKCPYCRQSLMDEEKTIDGLPSIKVSIQFHDKKGLLYLSSIYGSYTISSEIRIPIDEIVLFFCPHCQSSLLTNNLCEKCHVPMATFELKQGGRVQICSKRGCKKHMIEFSNLSQEISTFYSEYSVPTLSDQKK
jgi:ssDNA-binding Zn-finger/Zn-ribbon topoisomerase 1